MAKAKASRPLNTAIKTCGTVHAADSSCSLVRRNKELSPSALVEAVRAVYQPGKYLSAAYKYLFKESPRPGDPEHKPDWREELLRDPYHGWFPDPCTNPWKNSEPIAPSVIEKTPHRDLFTSLPVDIMFDVFDSLPLASQAAVSLTCSALYKGFSDRVFRAMGDDDYWEYLILIEKDAGPLKIACRLCSTVHMPQILGGPQCRPPNKDAFYLAGFITPDLCRLLVRHVLMSQPNTDIFARLPTKWQHVLHDCKMFNEIKLNVFAGNLILRNETYIAPLLPDGRITERSARLLREYLNGDHTFGSICNHWCWNAAGIDVDWKLLERARPRASRSSAATDAVHSQAEKAQLEHDHPHHFCNDRRAVMPRVVFDTVISPTLKCALRHPQPCVDRYCLEGTSWGLSHPRFAARCCTCATEFCLGAQDVDGVGRVLVLTTWKDLGGFEPGEWKKWEGHRPAFNCTLEDIRDHGGRLARAFDSSHHGGYFYKAEIGLEALEVLRGATSLTWSMLDEEQCMKEGFEEGWEESNRWLGE